MLHHPWQLINRHRWQLTGATVNGYTHDKLFSGWKIINDSQYRQWRQGLASWPLSIRPSIHRRLIAAECRHHSRDYKPYGVSVSDHTLIARFMGPPWGPPGPRWAPCWPHGTCYLGRFRWYIQMAYCKVCPLEQLSVNFELWVNVRISKRTLLFAVRYGNSITQANTGQRFDWYF